MNYFSLMIKKRLENKEEAEEGEVKEEKKNKKITSITSTMVKGQSFEGGLGDLVVQDVFFFWWKTCTCIVYWSD